MRGVDGLAPRWEGVLDGIERSGPSSFIHAYPLHNLLRLVALCVAGRETAPLIDGLRSAAEEARETNPQLESTVLPLAEALVRLLSEHEVTAKQALLDLKGSSCWSCVGGSEEQRGFLLELATGPVRAGKTVA